MAEEAGEIVTLTESQLELCQQMRLLAGNVFELVRWQLQDFIAKSILSSLVYKTVDRVAVTLTVKLNVGDKVDEIIREAEDIHARRISLKHRMENYKEALQLLDHAMTGAL